MGVQYFKVTSSACPATPTASVIKTPLTATLSPPANEVLGLRKDSNSINSIQFHYIQQSDNFGQRQLFRLTRAHPVLPLSLPDFLHHQGTAVIVSRRSGSMCSGSPSYNAGKPGI